MTKSQKKCNTCGRIFAAASDFLQGTNRWRLDEAGHLWMNCNCGSTMILPKGNYEWYNPEKNFSGSALSIFEILAQKRSIPPFPSAVLKIQNQLLDENADTEHIVLELKREPFLAASVLETANNYKIAESTKITSLEHAVAYIGRKTLGDLLLVSAIRRMSLLYAYKVFSQAQFWKHSFLAGYAAEKLAQKYAKCEPSQAYIAGCLANVGQLVLGMFDPIELDRVASQVRQWPNLLSWCDFEIKSAYAYRHTILGEIAAVLWGLPSYVRDAIALHHDLTKVLLDNGRPFNLNDIVAASIQIAYLLDGSPHFTSSRMLDAFKNKAKLDDDGLMELVRELNVGAGGGRLPVEATAR